MCFAMFGCCGPPPYATFKAYNNTTPFALDWYDDRDGGDGGIRETAITDWNDETGYTTGVLSCGDGSEITGVENDNVVLERDADDGDHQTSSSSTSPNICFLPRGGYSTMIKTTAVSGPFGGTWMWSWYGGTSVSAPFTIPSLAFFDLDIVQQCRISLPYYSGLEASQPAASCTSIGLHTNQELIVGARSGTGWTSGVTTGIAKKYSYSGTVMDTLLATDLSIASFSTNALQAWIAREEAAASFLVLGNKSGNRYAFVMDKATFSETSVLTTAAPTTPEQYSINVRSYDAGSASRVTSTHAVAYLRGNDISKPMDGSIVCINLSTPSEEWVKSDKVRRFVAIDSSQVYTLNPTTGELSAVAISGGAEVWTLDLSDDEKLGTSDSRVYGAVLSSGNIAVWRNAGVTIVTTAGVEVATVDVGLCYGIIEKSNRWLIVGAKRTTSS